MCDHGSVLCKIEDGTRSAVMCEDLFYYYPWAETAEQSGAEEETKPSQPLTF